MLIEVVQMIQQSLVAPIAIAIIHFIIVAICAWYDPTLVSMRCVRGWISFFVLVGSIHTLFRASLSDPGFVPVLSKDGSELPCIGEEDSAGNQFHCSVCGVDVPLRAKHCSDIGRCVRTFDHYCTWTANAVGEFNRPTFLFYLFFQNAALSWFSINSFSQIAESAGIRKDQLASFTALIIAITVMCIFWLMTTLLLFYHIFLACANLTTWEQISWSRITYLKDLPQSQGSPFSEESVLRNIKQYLRFRGSVDLDDVGGIVWRLGIQRSVLPPCCAICNEW